MLCSSSCRNLKLIPIHRMNPSCSTFSRMAIHIRTGRSTGSILRSGASITPSKEEE